MINKICLMGMSILAMGYDLDLIWTIKQPLNRYELRWNRIKYACGVCNILFVVYLLITNNYLPELTGLQIGTMSDLF